MKINLSSWKKVKLITLFEPLLSLGDNQENKLLDGTVPLVSAGKFQNGIVKYVETGDGISQKFDGNLITVDMFGQAFYQPMPFYAVSHGRVNILKPLFDLNEKRGLFFSCVLTKLFSEKYAINDMCSQTALMNEHIYLPHNERDEIDFCFMDKYIDDLLVECKIKISNVEKISMSVAKKNIDVSNWKEFTIFEIFGEPEKPKTRAYDSYISGDIPFVSSGNDNNGVKGFVCSNNEALDKGNCITVSAVDGSTFYQPYDFLGRGGGGSSINILRNSYLNKYNGLFLAAVIGKVCSKYKFADMCSAKYLIKEKIFLPVKEDGSINYEFMENYIKEVEDLRLKKSKLIFEAFNQKTEI